MTAGIPSTPSALRPPSGCAGIYQKNAHNVGSDSKSNHIRTLSIKRATPDGSITRRRSLDSNVPRNPSPLAQKLENQTVPELQISRTRRLSGSVISPNSINNTTSDENSTDCAVKANSHTRTSILQRTPSPLAKRNIPTPTSCSSTRIPRLPGRKTSDSKNTNSDNKHTDSQTDRKQALIRRRSFDPNVMNRLAYSKKNIENKENEVEIAEPKRRMSIPISQINMAKNKEEKEKDLKEFQEKQILYDKKFLAFKQNSALINKDNADLKKRIENLRSQLVDIRTRYGCLAASMDILF